MVTVTIYGCVGKVFAGTECNRSGARDVDRQIQAGELDVSAGVNDDVSVAAGGRNVYVAVYGHRIRSRRTECTDGNVIAAGLSHIFVDDNRAAGLDHDLPADCIVTGACDSGKIEIAIVFMADGINVNAAVGILDEDVSRGRGSCSSSCGDGVGTDEDLTAGIYVANAAD